MQKSWCFHLSLNVSSLARAIDFYRVLFDMEPAKCHDDYAKFEVQEPPVVFSLVPHKAAGPRSRVGLALESTDHLQALGERLESKGIHVEHTGETSIAATDPDGNAWQFNVGDDGPAWGVAESAQEPSLPTSGEPLVWEHYVTADLPSRVPYSDGSVDEIRLTGTLNTTHPDSVRGSLIADAYRALKPGGRVVAHGLAGDKPFPNGMPTLPGLASMVAFVPTHQAIAQALKQAGFVELQFVKFGDKAWFEHDGVEMREVKVVATKPIASADADREVIYRGPFHQIRDDQGHVFERGRRARLPAATWTMLRQSPQAEQFVFVESQGPKTCQTH